MNAPSPAPGPGETDDARIEVEIEEEAWLEVLADAPALVRQAAEAALLGVQPAGGVVVLLTGDDAVRDLNHRFRGRDVATNVLAFPAAQPPGGAMRGPAPLGDIALAFGVCAGEARAQGKPLADHLRHLVAHGVLHLLGHDHQDEDEAQEMEGLERRLLAAIGVPDPYGGEPAPGAHEPESHDPVAKDAPPHVP